MARTRHIHQRMSQRGISGRLIDLVSRYGVDNGDKVVLDRKNTEALLKAMDAMRQDLLAIQAKGGVVVVEQNGVQITTYALDSYSRRATGGCHAAH
ncbi:hypothetical protein CFI10_12920 [Marinobacterium iners]|uniref:hypothetical protein n=1 Tax=Marinobacterium iners TaxID=48076 RepID=UPI001A8D83F8|nr:hypothetical protein [Marinobacterium iners]QSR35887.1 hypothetical protein CFI10_12920 [Marinobacterium iners]